MKTEILKEDFLRLCGSLKRRPNVLHTEVTENKRDCVFTMYLYAIRVDLVYCWKWETLAPPSVLYCRFYLNKNEDLFLHLPELIAFLERQDYRACYFPYIENTQRMESCFEVLMKLVDDYIPQAEKIVQNGQAEPLMRSWFERSFFDTDKVSDTTLIYDDLDQRQYMADINYAFESIMVGRHTNFGPYAAFLLGKWEMALKKYRKQEKHGLSAYERGLCRFMEDPANRSFQPMPQACFSLPAYQTFMRSGKDLLGMILAWIPCVIVLCGITAIINAVRSSGTVHYLGMSAWLSMAFAGLPAVFGYAVFQQHILGWMRRKKDMEYYTMMDNHPVINKLGAVILAVCVIISLCASVGLPLMSYRFYDSYAVCSIEKIDDLRFEYDEIEAIYYIHGRYNEFGDLVNRGSYVFILDDGTQVDLDCVASVKAQAKLVQHLFADRDVIEVESNRDLP